MQKHKKLSARILSMALSVVMVTTMLPMTVFAAEGDVPLGASSLECHVEHDEDCGYVEAVEGVACTHLNDDGTYSCTLELDSGDVSGNAASPSDAEKEYVCDHMDDCGYIEVVEGVSCQHSCDICQIKDSSAMMSNQVRAENEITISDVTVSGTVGKPLASGITATLTLSGAENFGFMQSGGTIKVAKWFTGLPAGIDVRAKITIENPLTAILTFSGTPTATSSDVMAITIPGDEDSWVIAPFGDDYLVKSNSNAKFAIEPAKTPTSIAISTPPTKTTYTAGESFDKAGMVVTATYDNSSTGVVTDYTVTPSGALDAGTSSVTISYTENNATVTATQAITVNKANYSGTALSATVEKPKTTSGAQTYDLSALLSGKTGFVDVSYAAGSTTNTAGVLSGNATVSGSTLNYTLTGTGEKDNTATVTVTVSSKNYNDVTATITIKLIDKTPITIGGVTAPATMPKYTDTAVTNSLFGTPTFTPTWIGTPEYTYYDVSSGEIKLSGAPKNAGSYKVKIAIPDSDTTYTGEKTINFTIDKAEITVQADDKSMIAGGTLPAFTVTYTGFVGAENANNAALTTAAVANCIADGTTTGTFDITIGTQAVLNATVGANYTIKSQEKGTLTVSEQVYVVTISGGGSGAGNYTPGATVSIDAGSKSGYTFNGWTASPAVTFANASSASTSFTMPSSNVTITSNWTYNGGGGGGGSSSGGSTTTPPTSNVINPTEGNKGATGVVSNAVKDAIATGGNTVNTRATFNNYDALTVDGLKTINDIVAKEAAGKTVNFKVNFDAGSKNAVTSRITVDPSALAKVMTENLKLGVYFDQSKDAKVQAVNNLFEKHFTNKIVSVVYEQKSSLAVNAEFCAKLNLANTFGTDKNLYFYTYDNVKNLYNRIAAPGYWVDKNGYAHINAPLGGSVIITDKPLTKK